MIGNTTLHPLSRQEGNHIIIGSRLSQYIPGIVIEQYGY